MGAGLRTNAKVVGLTTGPYRRRASPRPYQVRAGTGACADRLAGGESSLLRDRGTGVEPEDVDVESAGPWGWRGDALPTLFVSVDMSRRGSGEDRTQHDRAQTAGGRVLSAIRCRASSFGNSLGRRSSGFPQNTGLVRSDGGIEAEKPLGEPKKESPKGLPHVSHAFQQRDSVYGPFGVTKSPDLTCFDQLCAHIGHLIAYSGDRSGSPRAPAGASDTSAGCATGCALPGPADGRRATPGCAGPRRKRLALPPRAVRLRPAAVRRSSLLQAPPLERPRQDRWGAPALVPDTRVAGAGPSSA